MNDGGSDTPTISVIVPATNRPVTLPRCVAALRRQVDPPDELIVVERPPRLGAVEARNQGAREARGEVIVFVDADVEAHPDAVARVRAAFARAADLTAVFGSYDDAPSARGVVSAFRNLLHHHVHQRSAGPADTFWTGLGAVRRVDFESVGGFDSDSFARPSVEDIDLGMRLARRGARIELDPEVRGKHLKRWTLRDMVRTDFARRGVPWVRLQLAARLAGRSLNLGWRHRLSAGASLIGTGALTLGELVVLGVASLTLLALNASFYGLLARRLGVPRALAGIALHVLHHLVGVTALAAGVTLHLAAGSRRRLAGRVRRPALAEAAAGDPAEQAGRG